MIIRNQLETLVKRVAEKRQFIQVVSGPRQVGKTTVMFQLIERLGDKVFYISADDQISSFNTWLPQQWETIRLKLKQSDQNEIVLIIDEIQKIDNWSETIKKYWDEDSKENRNIKLILLGSSRLLIQKGLTESLGGRFESIYIGHWSFAEMQAAFNISWEQYIWFGGYPGAAHLINDEVRWKSYIQNSLIETSISKDILMLTRIDKPALLRQLFQLGSLYSGQILSFNKILGQLQNAGNTTTLSNYLHALDSAGLLAGLEKFTTNVINQRSSSPKFQVYNNALLSALSTKKYNDILTDAEEWGIMVESSVGSYLLNQSLQQGYQLSYWRDGNDEVDFVLSYQGKIVALEVKSSKVKNTNGMTAFNKKFKKVKSYLVGNTGISISDFLKMNVLDLF